MKNYFSTINRFFKNLRLVVVSVVRVNQCAFVTPDGMVLKKEEETCGCGSECQCKENCGCNE